MEKNRLRWASRRGMLELDLVLYPFVENHYDYLSEEDKKLFQLLLEEQDQDMFNWFIYRQEPESSSLQRIVSIIRTKTGSEAIS
ncbi:MAG: succinate dehydrogenase assembly factor 2 [Porticoccaceae bacterium]